MRTARALRRDPVFVVGMASAAAGFLVGAIGYGCWQVAVESAQVVAGLVAYPRDNPFYMYHTKLWTLLHQVGALALRAGMSETTLSLLFSGLLGAVSFPALSLATFALCRDRLVSLGVPFFLELTRATSFEIAYPIWLLGSTHTYGVIGLSYALLVAALFGNGRFRGAAFALGLAPAVHPSIGAWMWLIVGLALAWDFRAVRDRLWGARFFFVGGAAAAAASLAAHLLVTYDVPRADPEASSRYLSAFVRQWDVHRQPASLHKPGVYVAAGALAVTLLWLRVFPAPSAEARLLLRILAVSGVLGLVFLLLSWAPTEKVPDALLILMPNRLVNLIALASVPLVVGLLASRAHWAFSLNLATLLGLGVVTAGAFGAGYLRPNTNFHPGYHFVLWPPVVPVVGLGVSALLLVLATARARPPEPPPETKPSKHKKAKAAAPPPRLVFVPILRVAVVAALAWSALVTAQRTWRHWPLRDLVLRDRHNDALFAQVAAQEGLLVTASDLHLVQLRTRRPVLIDGGGLDLLAYTLEAGPAMEQILRRVYGIDLFHPPPEAAEGLIPRTASRLVWEARPEEEWRKIGVELGATGVLAYSDWRIRLPLVARDEELAFYRITP